MLIDGHSILNRAFYGIPDMTNVDGLHTNAVFGFLNIMFKILEEEKPEYLTVAFDVHAPTFRHDMFAEYKGTRKPMLEELRQQVPIMKEVLQAMGILVVEQAGLEADDLLGTISRIGEEKGLDVAIISGDRDLLQLATEKVKIRIPKTKQGKTEIEDYYAVDVQERYQVTPQEFIDVKALMGDASDNIPGVPSIGEKTATKIIVSYGSIENAYAHVEELKPPRASKALLEHYELAEMSKTLATIEVHADFPYDITQAKIGDFYTQEAFEWFQELEFKKYLSKFTNVEVTQPALEVRLEVAETKEAVEAVLAKVQGQACVGVALAKEGPEVLPLFAHPSGYGGIAVSYEEQVTHLLKASNELPMETLFTVVSQVLATVEQVAVFDLKVALQELAIEEERAFDGIIAAYLLNPVRSSYSVADVAKEYLSYILEEQGDIAQTAMYCANIAMRTVQPLREKLEATGMWKLFCEVEMPLVFTLYDMEQNGIQVEGSALKLYGEELAQKIQQLQEAIYQAAGEEFNINSPKQLGVILFEKLELPHGKKTKTGYSTSADVLDKLAGEYPIVSQVLEYRQLAKLKSTYAEGLATCIQADGRIHGTFNQTVTATGRISSTEPNLQNIPIRMELGRLIRKVFVPAEGFVFMDADYSQIELRILAHCSNDEKLIEAYQTEMDIHRLTASQVFDTPFEEVTELQRRNAKAVNFGIVYGISAFSLSDDLGISRKEAQAYIDKYFATYPGIKTFLDESVQQAKEKGYAETIFGRRRPIPELLSSNFMQRSFGERVAMNAPIQGAAADIMKLAMNRVSQELRQRGLQSKLVLQVHDELLIEVAKSEQEEVAQILCRNMEEAATLQVKLEVDMHVGNNWYEAK